MAIVFIDPFPKVWKILSRRFQTVERFLPVFSKHWKNKRQLLLFPLKNRPESLIYIDAAREPF